MTLYSDYLDRPAGTAETPTPLPPGSYIAEIKKWQKDKGNRKDGSPYEQINLTLNALKPMEDVDESQLPDNWQKIPIKATFWLGKSSEYKLDNFLSKTMAMDMSKKESGRVYLDRCVNETVLAILTQEMDKETQAPKYNRVERLLPTP